jgi:hypothetical protein
MSRISAFPALLLSAVLALGQQPQNHGQNALSGAPATLPGERPQPTHATSQDTVNAIAPNAGAQGSNAQNQSEMQGVLRACAALLAAATAAACPADAAQPQEQPQQQQQQPSQPRANMQDKSGANSQIQSDLQSALKSDPALSGTDVQVSVDDVNITLTGTVQAQGQLDRVMALASPYARYRNVVNKIAIH